MTVHPSTQSVLDFFDCSHLPPHLAEVVEPFAEVVEPFAALAMKCAQVPGPESIVAIRKLLEAKDAAVRSVVAARKAGG